MADRFLSILAGSWLTASAFLWPHSPGQRANAIVAGVLAVVFALLNLYRPRLRYLSGLLALWIFLYSVLTSHVREATLWSNGVCAILILLGMLVGNSPRRTTSDAPA